MGSDAIISVDPSTGEISQAMGSGVEEARATAESQAGFLIAKQFPRDIDHRRQNILKMCTSVALAESAEYSFPKGGTEVRGPSIKLLEAIGQEWGNLISGIRELEVREDATVMQAYCYDLETNRREERIFTVPHHIKTKKGVKYLDDPRDRYELTANMGSRRKRACMEAVIPRWVVDEATEVCRDTVDTKGEPPNDENVKKMLKAFAELGVTEDMIETRIQKKTRAITGPEFAQLKRIYKGIRDGMSKAEHWFDDTIIEPKRAEKPKEEEKKPPAKSKRKPAAAKKKAEPKAEEPPPMPPGDPEEPPAPDPDDPGPSEGDAVPPAEEEEKPEPEKKPGGNLEVTDRISEAKFIKEGVNQAGNPYSLYHVYCHGGLRLSCFDKYVVEVAEDAVEQGYLCRIEYIDTGKHLNLLEIEILG